jgi:HD-like signal output (HDOD) protein
MNRILFVDDEPRVLEGLRRMLHFAGQEWDVVFVRSGPEALERAARRTFDAVVTDVRMPGMDGSELLEQVAEHSPATVRFILTGQCRREVAMKTVGLAHQFFTKPCDPGALRAAVSRACGALGCLQDRGHKALVARVKCVPSSPLACRSLLAELEAAEPSAERLGRIVSRDVGLTAKLLQLVSSGFFGFPQRGNDPARWAAFLGIETLRLLVLSAGVVNYAERNLPAECSVGTLNKHSRKVADGAMAITAYETGDPAVIGQAYLAGLLHDVGRPVLADQFPDCCARAWSRSRAQRPSVCEMEKAVLGTTHADVGAGLMALWGAPEAIVDAVWLHHCPSRSDASRFGPLAAVHVADAAATAAALGLPLDARLVDSEFLARVGCADRLDAWWDLCRTAGSREMA